MLLTAAAGRVSRVALASTLKPAAAQRGAAWQFVHVARPGQTGLPGLVRRAGIMAG